MASLIAEKVTYTLSLYGHVLKLKESISIDELKERIKNTYKPSKMLDENLKVLDYIKDKIVERNLFGRLIVH